MKVHSLGHVALTVRDLRRSERFRMGVDHIAFKVIDSPPDGNGVELYVDQSDVWKHDPQSTPTSTLLEKGR